MTALRTASRDASLRAVITSRRPLFYALGSDAAEDRPAHIRAASSLAWIDGQIAVVQDDANFVALLNAFGGEARAITLPRGVGGSRLFDDARGNKKYKLDLEASVAVSGAGGTTLLAFGSGSGKRRRQIGSVDQISEHASRVRIVDATSFYERLEAESSFAGSDMNVEGVVLINDQLRFFGRGNGKARRGLRPLNATCDVAIDALLAYLDDTSRTPPTPRRVVEYALGQLDGTPLGFTDAAVCGADVLYSATAEASDDATVDGAVTGSVLGVIEHTGRVRYIEITDQTGAPLRDKVEGVLLSPTASRCAYLVIDADDTTRPSELCDVALHGDWGEGLRNAS